MVLSRRTGRVAGGGGCRRHAEVYPRRPGNLGEYASREAGLSGKVVILRVRISSIEEGRIYEGEAAEDEYLIEGTVEDVSFSEGEADD